MDLPPPRFFEAYTAPGAGPAPPRLPADGQIAAFGQAIEFDSTIVGPIEQYNIPRLFAAGENYDRIAELQKLNALVLETFAKLVDNTTASANDEEERRRLLDKLAVIFPNMHHLLNEYRPHQAVYTIKAMLETQTKQREDMAEEIRANVDAARSQMADISSRARACIEEIEDTLRAAIQPAPATEAAERRILTSGHIADPSALDEELALRALLSDD